MTEKKLMGFATIEPEKRREIARKGGRAAHRMGRAHEFTSCEAREAGRKGGKTTQERYRSNKGSV